MVSSVTSRVSPDRQRLQAVDGMRCTVMAATAQVSGHPEAGLESGRRWVVGSGRVWVVCPVGNRSWLAVRVQNRVQVCRGEARLTRESGSSSGNLERYSWNKGKHYAGGDTSTGEFAATRR